MSVLLLNNLRQQLRSNGSSSSSIQAQICVACLATNHRGFSSSSQQHSAAGGTKSSSSDDDASQASSLAFLQEELAALSIPSGELTRLANGGLSDAALTAWALSKTSSHPAAATAAAAASQRLQYLLAKLDGALMRQQAAASSPTAELLWRVAVAAAQQQLRGMSQEELEACVEYQAARAALRSRRSGSQQPAADAVLQQLEQQLPQLVDTSPRAALAHPAFWQLARAAADANPGLQEDLSLLGYNSLGDDGASSAASQQLQQVQALLGLDVAQLQQQLLAALKATSPNILLPQHQQQLLASVSGNAAARAALGQLQLVEVVAAALGLTAVQLSQAAPSSSELVRRLTGRVATPAPAISQQLEQALKAAAPTLLAAVSQLSVHNLAQPSIEAFLQMLSSKPELQALHKALTSWRAEAAAAGSLPVLTSLTQAEVSGVLSQVQADAVGRAVMQLEAAARLCVRQAAACRLDLAGLSPSEVDALAWRVHTGGQQAAEELVELLLVQAAELTSQAEAAADAAEGALTAMAAGFELEEATSRRSTAAPPSHYLMAGFPQLQLAELAQGSGDDGDGGQGAGAGSSNTSRMANINTAERLVRDLALLLTTNNNNTTTNSSATSGGPSNLQGAAQRLHVLAHDLPQVLSGPLLQLLAAFQPAGAEVVDPAASVQRRQQLLQIFMQVVAAELPQQLQAAGSSIGDSSGGRSAWAGSGYAGSVAAGGAAEGLVELLGEQEGGEVLKHAADRQAARRSARYAGGEGGEGPPEEADDEGQQHLHGWLSNVHHDQDMQRYLQIEFDPLLDVDVVHSPRGWRDPDLFTSAPDFLEAMRPLLNTYLAAQGEQHIQDLEWQVYKDSALAEAQQVEAEAARARHAAGHSPFNNSRADEAFLTQRLEAGIPKDSVLYAAAHRYLAASFKNRTWRFAQRKRMVDVLIRIADHLAAHPPRSHRGSPFSALFLQDGPPMVPRISSKEGAAVPDSDTYALPQGFAPTPPPAAPPAAAQ